jgi:hypothetical protein
MAYTLGQAARATGKAKPTIARAIQTGRLSASRSDDGSWAIDPAELHRVYPMTGKGNGHTLRVPPAGEPANAGVEHLQRLLAEREETIRDLRGRLDASEAERRQMAEDHRKLIAVLTDQRPPAPTPAPGSDRRGWRRWFR